MTSPNAPKSKSETLKSVAVVAAIGFALLLLNSNFREWLFAKISVHDNGTGSGGTTPPPPQRGPRDVLVGTWQTRLPTGADEVYVFEALGPLDEGTVNRQVFVNQQFVRNESWTGTYRWRDNPLLGDRDRTQLQIGFVDPVWGRKDFSLIVRSLSESTLVLEGVFDHQQFEFQRAK